MSIQFSCEQCGSLMGVPPEMAGRRVRCPQCKSVVAAPADESPAVEEPTFAPAGPFEDAPAGPPPDRSMAVPESDRPTRQAAGGGTAGTIAVILGVYSVIATAGVVWLWTESGEAEAAAEEKKAQDKFQSDPYRFMLDLFGEYDKAKHTGDQALGWRRRGKFPPTDLPMVDEMVMELGGALVIHDLSVKAVAVEHWPSLKGKLFTRNDPARPWGEAEVGGQQVLALKLELKNVSGDVAFHPIDPALHRRDSDPFAYLRVGQVRYTGPFNWNPAVRPSRARLRHFAGQRGDYDPLKPGQTRQTVVVTAPQDKAVRDVRSWAGGPLVWRVHLRTGLGKYKGREYSVTSVIGVRFDPDDVRWSAEGF